MIFNTIRHDDSGLDDHISPIQERLDRKIDEEIDNLTASFSSLSVQDFDSNRESKTQSITKSMQNLIDSKNSTIQPIKDCPAKSISHIVNPNVPLVSFKVENKRNPNRSSIIRRELETKYDEKSCTSVKCKKMYKSDNRMQTSGDESQKQILAAVDTLSLRICSKHLGEEQAISLFRKWILSLFIIDLLICKFIIQKFI